MAGNISGGGELSYTTAVWKQAVCYVCWIWRRGIIKNKGNFQVRTSAFRSVIAQGQSQGCWWREAGSRHPELRSEPGRAEGGGARVCTEPCAPSRECGSLLGSGTRALLCSPGVLTPGHSGRQSLLGPGHIAGILGSVLEAWGLVHRLTQPGHRELLK